VPWIAALAGLGVVTGLRTGIPALARRPLEPRGSLRITARRALSPHPANVVLVSDPRWELRRRPARVQCRGRHMSIGLSAIRSKGILPALKDRVCAPDYR